MILKDFECTRCEHQFEDLDWSNAEVAAYKNSDTKPCDMYCPKCGAEVKTIFKNRSAAILEKIIPTYPNCKKKKAGYTHTDHADQPATKIQSGYGGCQGPPIQ